MKLDQHLLISSPYPSHHQNNIQNFDGHRKLRQLLKDLLLLLKRSVHIFEKILLFKIYITLFSITVVVS